MRRVACLLAAAAAIAASVAAACRPRSLDLGSSRPTVEQDGAPAGPDIGDGQTPTYEQRLRARCDEPPGPADRYSSASDLTARVTGRWYLCGDESASPLGDPSGVELRSDGTWSILVFDSTRESLAPSTDPDQGGDFDYYAFSDADAGAGADGGGGSRSVPLDDPTLRGGLFIYLRRPISTIDIVILVDFESSPRRMLVRDAGPSSRAAFYVSVDGV